jgi:hypothetical protein
MAFLPFRVPRKGRVLTMKTQILPTEHPEFHWVLEYPPPLPTANNKGLNPIPQMMNARLTIPLANLQTRESIHSVWMH